MLIADPELARVIVEKADRAQVQLGVAHQFADDEAAAVTAADHDHLAKALADPQATDPAIGDHLDGKARTDQERERE